MKLTKKDKAAIKSAIECVIVHNAFKAPYSIASNWVYVKEPYAMELTVCGYSKTIMLFREPEDDPIEYTLSKHSIDEVIKDIEEFVKDKRDPVISKSFKDWVKI